MSSGLYPTNSRALYLYDIKNQQCSGLFAPPSVGVLHFCLALNHISFYQRPSYLVAPNFDPTIWIISQSIFDSDTSLLICSIIPILISQPLRTMLQNIFNISIRCLNDAHVHNNKSTLQRTIGLSKRRPRPALREEKVAHAVFKDGLYSIRQYRGLVRVDRWRWTLSLIRHCLTIAELECRNNIWFLLLSDHSPLLECVG